MKKIALSFLCCIFAMNSITAQRIGENFIKTTTMLTSTGSDYTTSIQYYDGLGRPTQVADNAIGNGSYVHTLQEYDANGRKSKTWLPLANTSGSSVAQSAFASSQGASYGYSTTEYDALNRPVFVSTPGNAWHQGNKGKSISYITNPSNDIKRYIVSTNGGLTLSSCYPAGTLYGEKTVDEDGHGIIIFKDIMGNVVLERRTFNGECNDTYYVYDQACRLSYVLPPMCTDASSDNLQKYAYHYKYDGYGNCIDKTLPGCQCISYQYDTAGRMKFMWDANLINAGKARFFLYDALGRLAVQGICDDCPTDGSIATVAHTPNSSGICGTGYSFTAPYSLINPQIEIVNYYDVYDFMSSPSVISAVHADFSKPGHELAMSLLTGCLQRNSDGSYTCSVNYYDQKGNLIDTRETVPGGGCTKTVTSYSFTNKPEVSTVTMTRKGVTRTVQVTNTYDSTTDKLHSVQHKYGTRDAVTTAEYSYNSLGQLSLLKQHDGTIETSYAYDLHGWLTDISSKKASTSTTLFAEKLLYADGSASSCYNGNISESRWATSPTASYRYKYTYDGMDRMTAASFHAGGDISQNISTAISDLGNVTVTYDANSNIQSLYRRGKLDNGYGEIDHLTYVRDGNQLRSITDYVSPIAYDGSPDFKDNAMLTPSGSSEYLYDGCGSLTGDANKGISKIDYDLLGNPTRIQFSNFNVVEYVYTADGRRLKTIHRKAVPRSQSLLMGNTHTLTASETQSVDSTEYIGDFVFENNAFKQYHFDGGYITSIGTPTYYKYYVKDHLGNNRILASYNGTVEQTTHYYPFGATHHLSTNQGVQKYKYNGKEFDAMHGLNMYDYGARQYDPAIAQFTTVDPLCEKYYHISPYAYCEGNPVNRVDPDGRSTWVAYKGNGQYTVIGGDLKDNDFNIYVYTHDPNGEQSIQGKNWTRGESIGKTPLMTSFYNSDTNSWAVGSIISIQDQSGINFLNKIKSPDISLIEYMWKARDKQEYDFKVTNGIKNNDGMDIYRGMPFTDPNGEKFYTSARDIGNIAAGYKASASGIGWKYAETAFDMYQSGSFIIKKREGFSTKNAEKYGYMLGRYSMLMRGRDPIINFATLIASFF